MLQIFKEDGTVVPVTKVEAGPCVVTQIKTKTKDGIFAVQIGFGKQKRFRLNKPALGHLKGINVNGDETITVRMLRDQRVNESTDLKRGDVFSVKIFTPGEKVQVIGTSKGKGFQGVVKRHGFHGGPATHGHKDNSRAPGSIGAGGVQRVFKGMRMAGHMGDSRVTVKNLEIIGINPDANEILIKGALPGARNSIVLISANDGKIEVENVKDVGSVQSVENVESVVDVGNEVKTTEQA